MEKEPITAQGLKKLKKELEELKNIKRPKIIEAIAEARAHGDLKENAEYHAAKDEQAKTEGRILEINDLVARANVIDITTIEKKDDIRTNSILRISHQRNKLIDCLGDADEDDYIFYSDNDEIPNFENINFESNKNKILIFKQKLFYYKFNLHCDWVDWFGTKGCRKKDFNSFSWLREIKAKKYPLYRFDTFFSKNKYMNVKIIEDGGWHFSQLKNAEDLEIKLLNQEHHDEYKLAKDKLPNVSELIKRKSIIYNHAAKSSEYKFSKEFKLRNVTLDYMPVYLKENKHKYKEWFD